ncbi:MAG TPA: hypothetical protein VM283_08775 [Armatimonadota bacterium]|nr:hypothetical protein [Armatimonadota bacterium]
MSEPLEVLLRLDRGPVAIMIFRRPRRRRGRAWYHAVVARQNPNLTLTFIAQAMYLDSARRAMTWCERRAAAVLAGE